MTQQLPDWRMCERIRDDNSVDEAIRALLDDNTGDNATHVVRAVLIAHEVDTNNAN